MRIFLTSYNYRQKVFLLGKMHKKQEKLSLINIIKNINHETTIKTYERITR